MQTMEAKLKANVEKVGLELIGKILRLDRKFTLILVNQRVFVKGFRSDKVNFAVF